ncbi:serine/threonine-protein kinase 31 [Anaeramoeba ignava]|uniref:Serine/threonine-protein kinase 31 n=1 Tax=Anaeramoeba ignava TaxID=1746090 RepID=A0A9Q0L8G8_ANAIG|nr:serine/threonine-protein kinase 31 [Anaeramoeba ignava]
MNFNQAQILSKELKIKDSVLELLNKSTKETELFSKSFIGIKTIGKCVDVYDGDTVKVVIPIYNYSLVKQFSCRIYGVDTPELRPKGIGKEDPNSEKYKKLQREREAGLKSKEFVEKLILEKFVKLEIKGFDKYGRLLADILINDPKNKTKEINLAELLISKGLGVYYDGGTKIGFEEKPKRKQIKKRKQNNQIENQKGKQKTNQNQNQNQNQKRNKRKIPKETKENSKCF